MKYYKCIAMGGDGCDSTDGLAVGKLLIRVDSEWDTEKRYRFARYSDEKTYYNRYPQRMRPCIGLMAVTTEVEL